MKPRLRWISLANYAENRDSWERHYRDQIDRDLRCGDGDEQWVRTSSGDDLAIEAETDALTAATRLRQECDELIQSAPFDRERLLAFVERAKQRLNVIATATPFVREAGER